MSLKLSSKYKIRRNIGSGAFGEVYSARDTETGDKVAIKAESSKTRYPQLLHEAKLIKMLSGKGIPELKAALIEGEHNIIVMTLLGKNLESLLRYCGGKFTVHTTAMFALQALERIEHVQNLDFIHRDIKPDNFAIGLEDPSCINLIDFGLAKKFRDTKTFQHISWKEGKNLTGTARYASISTHKGYEQSRRDDLESLGYILVYFLKGKLPWQGLPAKTKLQKYSKIQDKKQRIPLQTLCSGLPKEIAQFIKYARSLDFEDKPYFSDLKSLFEGLLKRKGLKNDLRFDWIKKKKKKENKSLSSDSHKKKGPNYIDELRDILK